MAAILPEGHLWSTGTVTPRGFFQEFGVIDPGSVTFEDEFKHWKWADDGAGILRSLTPSQPLELGTVNYASGVMNLADISGDNSLLLDFKYSYGPLPPAPEFDVVHFDQSFGVPVTGSDHDHILPNTIMAISVYGSNETWSDNGDGVLRRIDDPTNELGTIDYETGMMDLANPPGAGGFIRMQYDFKVPKPQP